jgi:hypothetical protein
MEIKSDGRVHEDLHVPLPSKNASQRRCNICGRQASGRDLIQERLKQEKVSSIDQLDLSTRSRQCTRASHSSETSTDDNDLGEARRHHELDLDKSCADATSSRIVALGCWRKIDAGS